MTDVRTYDCPSPDCGYTAGGAAELLEHVNSEHAGEYQREDWPDMPAGRVGRAAAEPNDDEE